MEIIRSKDGTPIAYWHSGRGDPLLLVHGTIGDHLIWTPVRTALERHFSVYAMDRRGRGHSGDADAYALDRECEDVAAVIDAIGGTVHVIGHSFGGICALEAALLTPNIGRLILYEPAIWLGPRDESAAFDARMQALLEAGNPEEALLLFLRDIVKRPSQEIADMQAMPTWRGWVAAAHLIPRELRSVDRYAFDPQRFRTMRTPTVLFLGGDSPPRRRPVAETLNTALPNSQIVVLPGQQHGAMRTAPDVFVQEVDKFFIAATAG
jgi:pimeloyl-ACP methyl ester carboxylesterase